MMMIPDFGGVSRKYVDIEGAVKDAEDFYRPGKMITKMVLKAQSADLGNEFMDKQLKCSMGNDPAGIKIDKTQW